MTQLTLVRHGQTDWNLQKRIQGTSDIPLNDTGRAQARATGMALAAFAWDGLFASRLGRAIETAALIGRAVDARAESTGARVLGAPIVVPGIEERSYGGAEGLTGPEIAERFGSDRTNVPGWEDDSFVAERVLPALLRLGEQLPGDARVLVVTHGGVIGALTRHLTGGSLPRQGELIANGSAHDLVYADGALTVARFNIDPAEYGIGAGDVDGLGDDLVEAL